MQEQCPTEPRAEQHEHEAGEDRQHVDAVLVGRGARHRGREHARGEHGEDEARTADLEPHAWCF